MKQGTVIAIAAATAVVGAGAALATNPWWLVRAQFRRLRLQAGLDEAQVTAAAHRWVYACSDDAPDEAPTLVMLHGFTGSKENWYPVAERLRGRYRLLIPDLPGWGESERQAGEDYGFAAQATRVDGFIRALSPDKPVVLLGHSMGGGIAAVVAARYPMRVSRVGLLDAAGVRFADNAFGLDVLAGSNPFAVFDRDSMRRYIDTVFHRDAAKPWIPWLAARGLIAHRRADAAFEQSVLDAIGRGPEQLLPGEVTPGIQQPALLLWGRQDAVIDPSALDVFAAKMPHARCVLLDDCGHMSLVEQADAVADAVTALIEGGTSR